MNADKNGGRSWPMSGPCLFQLFKKTVFLHSTLGQPAGDLDDQFVVWIGGLLSHRAFDHL